MYAVGSPHCTESGPPAEMFVSIVRASLILMSTIYDLLIMRIGYSRTRSNDFCRSGYILPPNKRYSFGCLMEICGVDSHCGRYRCPPHPCLSSISVPKDKSVLVMCHTSGVYTAVCMFFSSPSL